MKKAFGWSVLVVAVACIVFLSGLFIGRSSISEPRRGTDDRTIIYVTMPPESPININTADSAELQTLPGIGEVLAQRIIDYRMQFGHFESIQQLTNVEGIGEKTIERIIEQICLED